MTILRNETELALIKARFEKKIHIQENGCHTWKTGTKEDGYPKFWLDGVRQRANRVAYELYVGKIPEGMCVCHTCDCNRCVNPTHLWIGTRKQNLEDCSNKGRKKVSEESRKRMSVSKLGTRPNVSLEVRKKRSEWAKNNLSTSSLGKHYICSEEKKKKISIANVGKKRSAEIRQKCRERMTGKYFVSLEEQRKLKERMMGNKYTLGRKIPKEEIEIRAAKIIGQKRTEETKKRMSEARKQYWKNKKTGIT